MQFSKFIHGAHEVERDALPGLTPLSQAAPRSCPIASTSFRSGFLRWSASVFTSLRLPTDPVNARRTDIRKPATQKAQIQRPPTSHSNTNSGTPSETRSTDLAQYTEPVSDDEEDEGNRHIGATADEAGWADLDPQAAAEAKAYREAQSKVAKGPGGRSEQSHLVAAPPKPPKSNEFFPKLTPANLSKLLDSRYELERDRGLNQQGPSTEAREEAEATGAAEATGNPSGLSLVPGRVEYVSSFRAGQGKKIAVPVRVEPKVFYANERTSAFRPFLHSAHR